MPILRWENELGNMETIRDTVPGRQCLASSCFITAEYDRCLTVLESIEEYVGETDDYLYDKAMTLAMLSRWAEAERYFLMIKNESILNDVHYLTCLCRSYIRNKKPDSAWDLYVECTSSESSKELLSILAADGYECGHYYIAMKAYDILNKYESDPSYTEGMIAAAVGVFRSILTQKEPATRLSEVLGVLASEPTAMEVYQTISQYASEVGDNEPLY